MVRASAARWRETIVDRMIGAAVIVGMSAMFVRWLNNDDDCGNDDDDDDDGPPSSATDAPASSRRATTIEGRDGGGRSSSRRRRRKDYDARRRMTTMMMIMRGWMPWWWPVIAMRGRNERHKAVVVANERRPSSRVVGDDDDRVVRNGVGEDEGDDDPTTAYDDDGAEEQYSHRGSCHCGSIEFVLRGPRRLRAVDLPGKIRYYPHVIISADRFQLLSGEDRIRFYYEDDKDIFSPSSKSIVASFDRHRAAAAAGGEGGGHGEAPDRASGAHSFCGNCGAHVFHADRHSGRLEVNANCLDGGASAAAAEPVRGARASSSSGASSVTANDDATAYRSRSSMHRSTTSSPGAVEGVVDVVDDVAPENPAMVTPSENEPPSGEGSACPSNGLDDNNNNGPTNDFLPRKESMSTDPTQSESYSTSMMLADGDDSSMGSLSVTMGAYYLPAYHPSQHGVVVASTTSTTTHDRSDRTGLPPLPPPSSSRMMLPSSDRSARTLPPRLGERYRYGRPAGGVRGGSIDGGGGGWSVASAESNDLDGVDDDAERQTTISPRMMDQMKKYLGRHINPIQED